MALMDRRKILRLGVAGVCTLAGAPVFAATTQRRFLSFEHLHTGEKDTITYWEDGAYVSDALKSLDHLLRDHRTDEVLSIDRDLFDQLHRLQRLVGSNQTFQVISGYRSPRTNAMLARRSGGVSKRSYHQFGMAIDVRLPGTGLRDLKSAALSMKAGGVGYYPRSNFVHLDTGRVRFW
ncbi:MAG: DUF882 domain-containing protein [Alphaproteobacteria bacterium]|nr:DUF882 domain-containing protein [Alphaproteobacteria bacterium]